MSLKGYQWLDDNGKVVMSFTFKDLTIDVWQDTTKEELDKFKQYLQSNSWNDVKLELHGHEIRSKRP